MARPGSDGNGRKTGAWGKGAVVVLLWLGLAFFFSLAAMAFTDDAYFWRMQAHQNDGDGVAPYTWIPHLAALAAPALALVVAGLAVRRIDRRKTGRDARIRRTALALFLVGALASLLLGMVYAGAESDGRDALSLARNCQWGEPSPDADCASAYEAARKDRLTPWWLAASFGAAGIAMAGFVVALVRHPA